LAWTQLLESRFIFLSGHNEIFQVAQDAHKETWDSAMRIDDGLRFGRRDCFHEVVAAGLDCCVVLDFHGVTDFLNGFLEGFKGPRFG
jgi:hypothetical protein